MYLMSFAAKLKRSGNPDHPDKFISIYIQRIFKTDPRLGIASIIPRNLSVLANGAPARCQSKRKIISKQRVMHLFQWEEIKEERKILPSKLIKSMAIFTALTDKIQCPKYPDWRSLFSGWLSRSSRAFRLFLPWPMNSSPLMGISFSSIAFWTHCWYCLKRLVHGFWELSPLRNFSANKRLKHLVILALHVSAGLPYAIHGNSGSS